MKATEYAQAVYALKEKDADTTVRGLVSVLKKRGALSLLPRILKEYTSLLSKEKTQKPVLIISDEAKKDDIFGQISDEIKKENPEIEINTSIIGGYIYKTKNIVLDKSYKSALLGMYRNIIKS